MISNLLKNPLIKAIGIIVIIYFALFANKQNPNSLGNRLSPEAIKKDLDEAQQKSHFIITNLRAAKNGQPVNDKSQLKQTSSIFDQLTIKDVDPGSGEGFIECGSRAAISYKIIDQKGEIIEKVLEGEFLIGQKNNWLVEKSVMGMKRQGSRIVSIPRDFKTDDAKLSQILNYSNSAIEYHITVLDFNKDSAASKLTCE